MKIYYEKEGEGFYVICGQRRFTSPKIGYATKRKDAWDLELFGVVRSKKFVSLSELKSYVKEKAK